MLKNELLKVWDENRVEEFCGALECNCKMYKIDCLDRFIEDIINENSQVGEEELIRYCNNMDAYVSDTEFMIDFFKAIRTPEGDAVAKRLEDDHEEVIRMVEALSDTGKIAYKEAPNEFLVWYK